VPPAVTTSSEVIPEEVLENKFEVEIIKNYFIIYGRRSRENSTSI